MAHKANTTATWELFRLIVRIAAGNEANNTKVREELNPSHRKTSVVIKEGKKKIQNFKRDKKY